MKKAKKLLLTAFASSLVLTGVLPVGNMLEENVYAIGNQQNQGQRSVSLGASLSNEQIVQTKNLLGASDVPESNVIYVDGPLINRYLNDGSGPATPVYSSAYIEQKDPGFGVQVQVLTPGNITVVTPQTYQNAAITAGAKNALIKIATVVPVTGEGALTGVYAMLENAGVQVNQKDVQVAQKEITVVSNVEEQTNLSNVQVNQLIADIKTEITNTLVNNGVIDESTTNNIITNTTNNLGLSDEDVQKIADVLKDYINEYKETEAAQNEDTVEQLEQSIGSAPDWKDYLQTVEISQSQDDLAQNGVSFPEGIQVNEAIQAFADKVKSNAQEGISSIDVYSHTFIYEMTQDALSDHDKHALNTVRGAIYQQEAQRGDQERQQNGQMSTKELMSQYLLNWDQNQTNDPNLAGIVKKIALSTGYAPQAYEYRDLTQEDHMVSFTIYENTPTHDSQLGTFKYDLETGQVYSVDQVSLTEGLASFDLGSLYGVNIPNNASPITVPSDYTIPGYTPEESSEESSEEVVEPTPEDTQTGEEITSQEPVEEAPQQQAPVEEPVLEEPVNETPVQ